MVGHSIDLPKIRDPTSIRTHAGHGGRLAAFTGRSVMGVVVTRHPAVGTATASGHPRYYEFGKAIARYREDSRPYGTETADRHGRSFRANDHDVQHLHGQACHHRDSDVRRSAVIGSDGECFDTLQVIDAVPVTF